MKSLEYFLETRARQQEHQAMMIRRYIKSPGKFLGSKKYTKEEAEFAELDAKKCKAALKYLKEYWMNHEEINRLKAAP